MKYDFKEKIWFNLSAFLVYNWPPPLVRHAKGMFCYCILCKADKVVDMGVLPRTKTPSMSVINTGLNYLCLRFLKWLCNAAILLTDQVTLEKSIWNFILISLDNIFTLKSWIINANFSKLWGHRNDDLKILDQSSSLWTQIRQNMDSSLENVPLLHWRNSWFIATYRFSTSRQVNEIILHPCCIKITFIS